MTAYLVIEIPEGEKYQVDSSFADMLDHSVDGFFVYNRDAHCAIGDITTQILSFLSRFANISILTSFSFSLEQYTAT